MQNQPSRNVPAAEKHNMEILLNPSVWLNSNMDLIIRGFFQ